MCLSYAWQYKCGCIAPKPTNIPVYHCASWDLRRSCEPKQLFSYLNVDCSPTCRWDVEVDEIPREEEDWFLQNGSYQGAPSEEEYFLHRVPIHLAEPVYVRRRRQAAAFRPTWANRSEYQESVVGGPRNEAEVSDEGGLALDLPPDTVVHDLEPAEHHVSNANFGGRVTRRKK